MTSIKYIFFSLLLTSCTPSLYYVATDSNFDKINDQPGERKIIYLDQKVGDLSKIDLIATIINKRKWKKFDKNLKTFSDRDQLFLKSIKQLINKDYKASYLSLDSISKEAYNCQVGLLKTDCLYALKIDSVDIKLRYQEAMNCAQNAIIKSIINTRYRFFRYGK